MADIHGEAETIIVPSRKEVKTKSLTVILEEESREGHDHVVLLGCWELRQRHVVGSWAQEKKKKHSQVLFYKQVLFF